MIDRKGLWILVLLCLAMTAAAVWRLSLLPDWTQMPMPTPKGLVTKSSFMLFIQPLALLFVIVVVAAQNWLISGPDEAVAAWYRRTGLLPLVVGVIAALMQTFIISRSLGHSLGLDAEAVARTIMAAIGLMVVAHGNVVPKLPRLSKRFAVLNLDPWQSARSRRFGAWMTVAFGLVMMVAAVLLPMQATKTTFLILALVFYGAIVWHFVRLKREPSRLP